MVQFHATNFLLFAVVFSLLMLSSIAQAGWEKTFGGEAWDAGDSVQQTADLGMMGGWSLNMKPELVAGITPTQREVQGRAINT